jgi:SAM-dependent methyltransferase
MSKIGNFTQPDSAPSYFIEFLEFLDNHADIKNFRTEAAKRLNLVPGNKVLDVGCGIGGATFPLAEITGPNGLATGMDVSSAMIEVASGPCREAGRAGIPWARLARFLMRTIFLTWRAAREFFCTCQTGPGPFMK